MRIKHNISFRKYSYGADKGSRHQIRMVTTFGGERIEISTGIRFSDSGIWNEKMGQFKAAISGSDTRTASELNRELARRASEMEDVFRYFEAMETVPVRADILERYRAKVNGGDPSATKTVTKPGTELRNKSGNVTTLSGSLKRKGVSHSVKTDRIADIFPEFVRECGIKNSWTEGTHQKMRSLLADLEAFSPGLRFSALDESALTRFVEYLRCDKVLHTPRRKKELRDSGDGPDRDDTVGIRNSTIRKKLGSLHSFLNWATKAGYNTQTAYREFSPTLKMTQQKVVYLTDAELRSVIALDISSVPFLGPVRDVFLFCCFSGLRYSDAQNLRWNDVKDGYMEVTTVKTADSILIEFNDVTRDILTRYRGLELPGDFVFPRMTNQAMNRELKELCRLAGLKERVRTTEYRGSERLDSIREKWEVVGTHTGRRTFIVQALSRGIPPNVVMKWTGHSDYKAMKPYIDIVDSIKAREMGKMNFLG